MDWKNAPMAHKIAMIIACIAVVFAVLPNIFGPEILPINTTYPAIAVFTLCEAVVYWNQKRKWSYLLIVGTIIMMACFLLEMSLL